MNLTSEPCEKIEISAQADLGTESIAIFPISIIKRSDKSSKKILIPQKLTSIDPNLIFSNSLSGIIRKKKLHEKIFGTRISASSSKPIRKLKKFDYNDTLLKPQNRLKIDFTSNRMSAEVKTPVKLHNSWKHEGLHENFKDFSDVLVSKRAVLTYDRKEPGRFCELAQGFRGILKRRNPRYRNIKEFL
ncbi:hypothetical protein SteCoe_32069 [Stentor coeruleus]|uniref:Uncharacterized protein n=1 Tax=Stentor coeruleus TaxID=5963 RepID=A0A1R2B092_9CILI|nr:hypothetical protein SteCoe_32069 [Stentor coeruleus]